MYFIEVHNAVNLFIPESIKKNTVYICIYLNNWKPCIPESIL